MNTIISIDAGNKSSGFSILTLPKTLCGLIESNKSLIDVISSKYVVNDTMVVIEDVRPYSKPLSMQTIDTVKFIGELQYRLENELQIPYTLITRSEVKQWAFDRFPLLCTDRIDKKILTNHNRKVAKGEKGYLNSDGTMRKASQNFVDDRIIVACMKLYWGIDTPKPGQKNKLGFKSHSYQALAVATVYIERQKALTK